ncbi:hypothetical protein PVAP13_3NG043890, partial [Panicum virgatum]
MAVPAAAGSSQPRHGSRLDLRPVNGPSGPDGVDRLLVHARHQQAAAGDGDPSSPPPVAVVRRGVPQRAVLAVAEVVVVVARRRAGEVAGRRAVRGDHAPDDARWVRASELARSRVVVLGARAPSAASGRARSISGGDCKSSVLRRWTERAPLAVAQRPELIQRFHAPPLAGGCRRCGMQDHRHGQFDRAGGPAVAVPCDVNGGRRLHSGKDLVAFEEPSATASPDRHCRGLLEHELRDHLCFGVIFLATGTEDVVAGFRFVGAHRLPAVAAGASATRHGEQPPPQVRVRRRRSAPTLGAPTLRPGTRLRFGDRSGGAGAARLLIRWLDGYGQQRGAAVPARLRRAGARRDDGPGVLERPRPERGRRQRQRRRRALAPQRVVPVEVALGGEDPDLVGVVGGVPAIRLHRRRCSASVPARLLAHGI